MALDRLQGIGGGLMMDILKGFLWGLGATFGYTLAMALLRLLHAA